MEYSNSACNLCVPSHAISPRWKSSGRGKQYQVMRKRCFWIVLTILISSSVLSFDRIIARAGASIDEQTLVLYDADSGNIPNSSLLGFTAFPPDGASVTYEGSSTTLDTTISGTETYAGWAASAVTTSGFPVLDSSQGVRVNISLQIESEIHEGNNRSGFSLIILDQEARGIELSFWENEIWAQNDDSTGVLFTHGEGIAFDTTAALIEYQITMVDDTYTLSADAQPILSGPLRDYSAFDRFPDPYETPNFLFLGDDTTSAQARVRLRFLSVTGTEPVFPTSTATSPNANLPPLTATPPVLPGVTPFPTPVAAHPAIDLCPSGWIAVIVTIGSMFRIGKSRRTKTNFFSGE